MCTVQGVQEVFKQLPAEMVKPSQLQSVVESGGTLKTCYCLYMLLVIVQILAVSMGPL